MKRNDKHCIICLINKEKSTVILNNEYFLIAVEKPYMNLYAHRDCYRNINHDELVQILSKNLEMCYNYYEKG